jgi:predicted RNA-binding protein
MISAKIAFGVGDMSLKIQFPSLYNIVQTPKPWWLISMMMEIGVGFLDEVFMLMRRKCGLNY